MTNPELRSIARQMLAHGGGFISSIGAAFLRADDANEELMRPLMLALIEKYPKYAEMARGVSA